MKERIDTLLALSASLAGQAKDLRDRASAIVTEEEKLRREIAAERALPLKVGYAIARRHRLGESADLRVELVTGFSLNGNADPMLANVVVHVEYAVVDRYNMEKRTASFDLGSKRFIIIDRNEARRELQFAFLDKSQEADDGE